MAEYVAVVGASAARAGDLEHAYAAGRRLAELGGSIRAERDGRVRGATFVVGLPTASSWLAGEGEGT